MNIDRSNSAFDRIVIDSIDNLTLKNVIDKLFLSDAICFSFRRVEDLTDESRLIQIKSRIFKEFESYEYIRKRDDRVFDSVAILNNSTSFIDLSVDIWDYFYSIYMFPVDVGFNFDSYKKFITSISGNDLYGEKHILHNYSNFVLMKGLGGDYLHISCKKEFYQKIINALG